MLDDTKIIAVIQARMSSNRLPNKVLLDVYGESILQRVINKLKSLDYPNFKVYVATSTNSEDDMIEMLCDRLGTSCFRGNLNDVRSRFLNIGTSENADIMIRATSDNPLTEIAYIRQMIDELISSPETDYCYMDSEHSLDGTSAEVFRFEKLLSLSEQNNSDADKEHVTTSLRKQSGANFLISNDKELQSRPYFVGIDTFEDYKHVCSWFNKFEGQNVLKNIIREIKDNPDLKHVRSN